MLQITFPRKFLAAMGFGLLAAAAWAQTLDAPPALELGDRWTYRFTNTGDKREPYVYVHEAKTLDDASVWLYGESQQPNAQPPKYVWRYDVKHAEFVERFAFDPAAPNGAGKRLADRQGNNDSLQFPLAVGKTYAVKQKWDNGNGFTEYKAEVQAFEKVKVGAGEFDSYRIKYSGYWTNTSTPGRTYTGPAEWIRWYAPSVKSTVKSEYLDRTSDSRPWNQNVTELVKWEPAKR